MRASNHTIRRPGLAVAGCLALLVGTLAFHQPVASLAQRAPSPRAGHTAVWTGSQMVIWGGAGIGRLLDDGGGYDPVAEAWSFLAGALLGPRRGHTAVWTDTQMIIWGGVGPGRLLDDGASYDPSNDTWTPVSADGAPSPRLGQTAVWTGTEMIIWGGTDREAGGEAFGDGGRYDPQADTWTPVSADGAPSPRFFHTAVWTGSEMIVWGGFGAGGILDVLGDGARYDPISDAWTPLAAAGAPTPRTSHTAVWTGSEMIIWGGQGRRIGGFPIDRNDGARYDPEADRWRSIAGTRAPGPRGGHVAVWTGSALIVWGGRGAGRLLDDGGRYDPEANTWEPLSIDGAPSPREGPAAVWAESEMVVWGGQPVLSPPVGDGARYDPDADAWTPME